MTNNLSSDEIRHQYIKYFVKKKEHTFVPSSSLVPGGDSTLLFTNAGMVQFKDVFLGTDKRPYTRAVNSQKCMRVAGKHNDLEEVGQDDTHHTFFEMLGNWSFGDYYKEEAIKWAWELLTEIWNLPKDRIYATCFKDEKGQIPTDDEAARFWASQPGMDKDRILFFGRKENFWEMANTGPCGPCSEIHFDRGPGCCEKHDVQGHICQVNGDCSRFLELWNLVFIQYNRTDESHFDPLPATHVDTGMGFERIVSVLQNKDSNYLTDLFSPILKSIQSLTGHTDLERSEQFTPYRVIADHCRAATFLIADGVVPGNIGRNYICRMIIRRAARFGTKIGLNEPFLAQIALSVIEIYGEAYPELVTNKGAILDNLTREEKRFQHTVESGIAHLESLFHQLTITNEKLLDGEKSFDLYATYGLPFEITRDIAQEQGFAMEAHRIASGAGKAMGEFSKEGIEVYQNFLQQLRGKGVLSDEALGYDPYRKTHVDATVLGILVNGELVTEANEGEKVEIILSDTSFYVAAGGQIADTGRIVYTTGPTWEIDVSDTLQPITGLIVHVGTVIKGTPKINSKAVASVDHQRRLDIMRNHTATHLLHAELHEVLGPHARQAGSLVAPDRLRFDFTHSDPLSHEELEEIEAGVNKHIIENFALNIAYKPLQQAKDEGAIAIFGEKYDDRVRNVKIGAFSNELCGGTHVSRTGEVGLFLIVSEGSIASGIRRIEAVTGREAYRTVNHKFNTLQTISSLMKVDPNQVLEKTQNLLEELRKAQKSIFNLLREKVSISFESQMRDVPEISGVKVLTSILPGADRDSLLSMTDRFRQKYNDNGVIVLASTDEEKFLLVAAITEDLVKRGLHAGNLVKRISEPIGGSGGGRPNLAHAGGKDHTKLAEALKNVTDWVEQNLKP
jgi:alanyl-tRNA synthetase